MHLTGDEIMSAINNDDWQKFRLSLRGKSTGVKLRELGSYLDYGITVGSEEHGLRLVRCQNYLNALARGGQIEPTDKEVAVFLQIREAKILR